MNISIHRAFIVQLFIFRIVTNIGDMVWIKWSCEIREVGLVGDFSAAGFRDFTYAVFTTSGKAFKP